MEKLRTFYDFYESNYLDILNLISLIKYFVACSQCDKKGAVSL